MRLRRLASVVLACLCIAASAHPVRSTYLSQSLPSVAAGTGHPLVTRTRATAVPGPLSALDFGQVLVANTQTLTVLLSNTGSSAIRTGRVTVSGPFHAATSCGTLLQPGESCPINVTFAPATTGELEGSLSVTGSGSSLSFPLHGEADSRALRLSASALDFGLSGPGDVAERDIFLENTGTLPVHLSGYEVDSGNGDFHVSGSCPGTLPVGAVCSVPIMFTAGTLSSARAVLEIRSDAWSAAAKVALSAYVTPPTYEFLSRGQRVTTLEFDDASPTSSIKSVRLLNSSAVTLRFRAAPVTASGPFSLSATTCQATLAPGASCEASVAYTGARLHPASGRLVVWSNATPAPSLPLHR